MEASTEGAKMDFSQITTPHLLARLTEIAEERSVYEGDHTTYEFIPELDKEKAEIEEEILRRCS